MRDHETVADELLEDVDDLTRTQWRRRVARLLHEHAQEIDELATETYDHDVTDPLRGAGDSSSEDEAEVQGSSP